MTDDVALGRSGLRVPRLMIGCWAWGDERYWSYRREQAGGLLDAFDVACDGGLAAFDTAEVYGDGASEKILGFFTRRHRGAVQVATKFGLLPGRTASTLPLALRASLRRLGRARVELYQVHWPDQRMASVVSLMDALADAVADGLAVAVGVSNFSADEVRRAHAALARRGVALASNQVRYGLLDRAVERDGVLDACRELDVTLLAYSPLAQGALSGSYDASTRPTDRRATEPWFAPSALTAATPLVSRLRELGAARGVGPSEVALAWTLRDGVVPIVGCRTGAHAAAAVRARSITLTVEERDELSRLA